MGDLRMALSFKPAKSEDEKGSVSPPAASPPQSALPGQPYWARRANARLPHDLSVSPRPAPARGNSSPNSSCVGSGAGAVALSGVRSRSHFSPGFPCGPLHCGDHVRALPFPAPATSIRACGSPAHGSPTFFTTGIRRVPPGFVMPGGDDDSIEAKQSQPAG